MKTKKIVLSSIITAVSFLFLYFSAVLPAGRIALFCIASASLCIVTAECGKGYGILSGMVAAVLGLLFLPNKFIAVGFAGFFAYYPVIKLMVEGMHKLVWELILKGIIFLAVAFLGGWVVKLMGLEADLAWFLYLGAVVVGYLYDVALSMIISIYWKRIRRYRKK